MNLSVTDGVVFKGKQMVIRVPKCMRAKKTYSNPMGIEKAKLGALELVY